MNNKSQHSYRFVVAFDSDYASLAHGQTAIDAVENYYSQIDAYCSPSYDEDYCEEIFVSAYRLPLDFSMDLLENFQSIDGEELSSEVLDLFQNNVSVICFTVRVLIKNGEMNFFQHE